MPTPSSYPPEPSLDAIGGRATFDGYVVRLLCHQDMQKMRRKP